MATLRGWAPCGTRLTAKVPHGHWKTTTFLAALRYDRIEAPWVLDGPIDGESFAIYVEKVLLPTLQPGDIVIMDNLGSHKGKAVRALIRSRGAKLFFLPKYSPDLNPIEQVFAKLKHLGRKPTLHQQPVEVTVRDVFAQKLPPVRQPSDPARSPPPEWPPAPPPQVPGQDGPLPRPPKLGSTRACRPR